MFLSSTHSIARLVITSFDVSLNQLESEAVIISEFPVISCLLVRSSGPEQLYKLEIPVSGSFNTRPTLDLKSALRLADFF